MIPDTAIAANGLHLCPKCGLETVAVKDMDPPAGYCGPCEWFTHATDDEVNAVMVRMTASLGLLDNLIEEEAKSPGSPAVVEIANTLMVFLAKKKEPAHD